MISKIQELDAVFCEVTELSSRGKSALTDHRKGQKHRNALSKVQNFFKARRSTSISDTAPLTS